MLSVILLLALLLTPVYAVGNDSEISVQAKGNCLRHDYSVFRGYSSSNNQHTYNCANPGCTSYMVEECYFSEFCGEYPDDERMPCSKCGRGTIYIHNYKPEHGFMQDDFYHVLSCTNIDEENEHMCYSTKGNEVECTLDTRQIWRGFTPNKGHQLTQTCKICDYSYRVGYYYPQYHPNYFDVNNDCEFCKMGSPYHKDWD